MNKIRLYRIKALILFIFIGIFPYKLIHAKIYKYNETPKVIIEGSTTLYNFVISKYKDSIEKEAGVKLIIRQTNSSKGLLAITEGKADMAMISTDFEALVKKINKENDFKFRPLNFYQFKVGEVSVDFIVHKNNPTSYIPAYELKNILTGKIDNWSDIGQRIDSINLGIIELVTEEETGGTFTFIENFFLDHQKITDNRITVTRSSDIIRTVSRLSGSIGFINNSIPDYLKQNIKIIETPVSDIRQELYLVVGKNKFDDKYINVINTIRKYANYTDNNSPNNNPIYDPYKN